MSAVALVMTTLFAHTPVLFDAVLHTARLAQQVHHIVDCTLGGAGHARGLLQAFPKAQLLGIDRDRDALDAARGVLDDFDDRVTLVHGDFCDIQTIVAEHLGLHTGADVLLADFGVSSYQIDSAQRGFSFRRDAPLDMRMDQSCGSSARELLENCDEKELRWVIRAYGEERFAKRIARALVACPPQTTFELAELVRAAIPAPHGRIDAATRTFQALRIWVNAELQQIDAWLTAVPEALSPGGVAVAISFHSLEDRRVKRAFAKAAQGCICPKGLPVCRCERSPKVSVVTRKVIVAADAEIAKNPRSRSAKLRAVRRMERIT